MLPIGTAFFVNWLVPFGMERFLNTDVLRQFLLVCVASIAPISVLSTIRVARRMHFQATDGRPTLLGYAGVGEHAAVVYSFRTKASAFVSAVALVVAFVGAVLLGPAQTEFPAVVAYASLLFAVGLLSAIEFNDLRRTAIHGALQSGA
ncbi:MAG: hypothetical protein Q8K23_11365 [Sulfuritalea sp.]|nr:hypothetical protein [Sulfuritalea sp.]